MAPGTRRWPSCSSKPTGEGCWIMPSRTSIRPRFAQPSPRQGRKKGADMDEPWDHALGLSRGGIGTKVHLAVEKNGLPLGFVLTRGNAHEAPAFAPLMARARAARPRLGLPERLAADEEYVSGDIGRWLEKRRIQALIPPKRAGRHFLDGQETKRLSRPQRRRTVRGQTQGVPPVGHTPRKTRPQLRRYGHPGHDRYLFEGLMRHSLDRNILPIAARVRLGRHT